MIRHVVPQIREAGPTIHETRVMGCCDEVQPADCLADSMTREFQ
jgi:hypothetical protein